MTYHNPPTTPRKSATFDDYTLSEIRRAAATGIYDIRGAGAKRKVPHFDDLLFLGASISRYPLEGYRESCGTNVVLGSRFAKKPIELKIPITVAGMSFGSLSGPAKEALGRGASLSGTSTTTGDGDPGLSVSALALWHEPARSPPRRCDRGRGRPGCQARWRRNAARPEDL
jgi:glutamate synthase domain-containing protein 2